MKTPTWFWIVAALLLVWNLMGVMNFFQHLFITDDALQAMPQNERTLYESYPIWSMIAFAVAVFGGVIGSVALLLKKGVAKNLFVASFVGILVQMGHSLMVSGEMGEGSEWVLIITGLVIVLGALAIWLSQYGIRKGWLN